MIESVCSCRGFKKKSREGRVIQKENSEIVQEKAQGHRDFKTSQMSS
jgi:hypothetical protein